ncbi:MAG: DUF1015 domain-containing protein [Calditrichia bacterium]
MATVRPFAALRPQKEYAPKIASPPYDVLSSDEAREMAKDNPLSFLHVVKPEIDLEPGIDHYDEKVYRKGAENLHKLVEKGYLQQDTSPSFYVYRQVMGNHQQVGLVACASVEEYEKDIIKKHELTRQEKEDDRLNHIKHLNAQTGPVFLTYRARESMDTLIDKAVSEPAEYDFEDENKVRHTFWVIRKNELIEAIQSEFKQVDYLYVADGHHRSAAAMRMKRLMQQQNPTHTGQEEYNFFLTVIFPHNQMQILDYNRIVKDLNGYSVNEFLEMVSRKFSLTPQDNGNEFKPSEKHTFGMYLNGQWYKLAAKEGIFNADDPVERLDVSILQNNLLSPILGIEDPRKDQRIDFVGGIRGLKELEKRVNSGDWQVAFALYPTSMDDLMAIADAGKIMPPTSTWFEPKLRSGLAIHLLD